MCEKARSADNSGHKNPIIRTASQRGPDALKPATSSAATEWKVGMAVADITPGESIRMGGYAARVTPSEGVHDPLTASAMAIEDNTGARSIMFAADLVSLARGLAEEILERVAEETGVPRERMFINTSHTHSGPINGRVFSELYVLSDEEKAVVARYTDALVEHFVAVARAAVDDLEPACLEYYSGYNMSWTEGAGIVSFGVNRRRYEGRDVENLPYPRGYVDRSVPLLTVSTPAGNLRGVVFGYACHNTTVGTLKISADYAGYARRLIEKNHPGTQAMFFIGCGADVNPWPRGDFSMVRRHGEELGREVCKMLEQPGAPVAGPLTIAFDRVGYPIAPKPPPDILESMRRKSAWQAKLAGFLENIIKTGKPWPEAYHTPLAVWQFGDSLTLVRMSGEIVSDYSQLIERAIGPLGLWSIGYCDEAFAYIPSERVYDEGGYESQDMIQGYGILSRDIQKVLLGKIETLAKRAGRQFK